MSGHRSWSGATFAPSVPLPIGARGLLGLVERHGVVGFRRRAADLLDYAERLTRNAIASWPKGGFRFDDVMDNDNYQTGPIPWTETKELPGHETRRLQKGDVIRHEQTGGGGHGEPALRNAAAMARDREDGKVMLA
jgi:N-methylhydantoinase B/oxoprolinase/acetone carboxylase alpha subunit